MAFQTFENDKNNRRQIKRKNLKTEIRSTWLAVKDLILNPQNYVGIVKEFNTELAKTILDKNIRTKLVDKPIF